MFDFLKKIHTCSICGKTSQNEKIVTYDSSSRGAIKENNPRQNLCLSHLESKWNIDLNVFTGRSVCFLPDKAYNSYSYSTLENAVQDFGLTDKEVSILSEKIQKYYSQKCETCGQSANFIFYEFPYTKIDRNAEIVDNPRILCSTHFSQRIIKGIIVDDLKLDEITAPYGNEGIFISGEY
jgi:hypothetical protein